MADYKDSAAYRRRNFFAPGRGFHVLWVEPARKTPPPAHVSGIKRFIAVRESDNYCTALPIVTYPSAGCSRKVEIHPKNYSSTRHSHWSQDLVQHNSNSHLAPRHPEIQPNPTISLAGMQNESEEETAALDLAHKRIGLAIQCHWEPG